MSSTPIANRTRSYSLSGLPSNQGDIPPFKTPEGGNPFLLGHTGVTLPVSAITVKQEKTITQPSSHPTEIMTATIAALQASIGAAATNSDFALVQSLSTNLSIAQAALALLSPPSTPLLPALSTPHRDHIPPLTNFNHVLPHLPLFLSGKDAITDPMDFLDRFTATLYAYDCPLTTAPRVFLHCFRESPVARDFMLKSVLSIAFDWKTVESLFLKSLAGRATWHHF